MNLLRAADGFDPEKLPEGGNVFADHELNALADLADTVREYLAAARIAEWRRRRVRATR